MKMKAIWLNGHIVNPHHTHLHACDHGVVVGDGVFETLLVIPHPKPTNGVKRQAFAVQRHLDRLRRSSDVLALECPYNDNDLRDAINKCLIAAPGAGIIRITMTSGKGPLSSSRGSGPASVMVMAGSQPKPRLPGTKVAVVPFPRNEKGALAGVKSTSYAENVIALRIASHKGATEAIFSDTQGRLSEGTGSNIFWIEDNSICTPPLDTGCLAGVTRSLVMDSVKVTEKHLPIEKLVDVEEAFLTSTTRCVQSIGQIDGTPLPTVGGPMTAKTSAAIAQLIATDIDP